MVEHPLPQVGGDPHSRAEKADAPQKAAYHHKHYDPDHRQADVLKQHLLVKGDCLAVYDHLPQIDAVDDQPVQLRDQKLDVVHHQKCHNAYKQHRRIFEVVSVDVFAEDHGGYTSLIHTVCGKGRR